MEFTPAVRRSRRWQLLAVVAAIVGLIIVATSIATILLWPAPDTAAQHISEQHTGETITSARVVAVTNTSCMQPGAQPDIHADAPEVDQPSEAQSCREVRAELPIGKQVTFTLDEIRSESHSFHEGDMIKLVEYQLGSGSDAETIYAFYDHPRGGKMLVVGIAFVLIVIFVGRWRGALALIGVGAAIAVLTVFILPAILSGRPPILVATTGAIGIMLIVLYLAHGVSHRTTAALFGSIFGILFTAIAGFAITRWLQFTGIASVEEASLLTAVPGLHMNDVLTATIVIAGLGILNDITVAQASAVWEMRELNPDLSKRRIYLSAMRVGRDHIASSIYTLVFAYAGAMLVALLLLYTYPRDLVELVTSEQIGQEIIRTLIGAAGLVLSMPVTTAFAVLFAREPAPRLLEAEPTPAA